MQWVASLKTTLTFIISLVPLERPVVNKERLGGYYRLSAYYLGVITGNIPLLLVVPFLVFTIIFWLSGLNYSFSVYIQMLLINMFPALIGQVRTQSLSTPVSQYSSLSVLSLSVLSLSVLSLSHWLYMWWPVHSVMTSHSRVLDCSLELWFCSLHLLWHVPSPLCYASVWQVSLR